MNTRISIRSQYTESVFCPSLNIKDYVLLPPKIKTIKESIRFNLPYKTDFFSKSFIEISPIAQEFITLNSLDKYIPLIESRSNEVITNNGLSYNYANIDVFTDIENTDWSCLKITYYICANTYTSILQIWKEIYELAYHDFPNEVKKKVYIILKKEKGCWYAI